MIQQRYAELKTSRLLLRTPTEADVKEVRAFGEEEFKSDAQALEFIRWINNRTDVCYNFYIWLAETNQMIGRVYFHSKAELNGEVEIGYGLYETYRNRGYMTEAAKAVVQFAFEKAGQKVLSAIVKPENIPSRRVLEKLGFTYQGVRSVLDNNQLVEFDYFQRKPEK